MREHEAWGSVIADYLTRRLDSVDAVRGCAVTLAEQDCLNDCRCRLFVLWLMPLHRAQ